MSFQENVKSKKEREKPLKLVSKYDSNYILCGDFNLDEKSQLVKDIEGCLKNLGPNYNVTTWTTKPFNYEEKKISKLEHRIDFVFGQK